MNYLGIYATYMKSIEVFIQGKKQKQLLLYMPLLSVSCTSAHDYNEVDSKETENEATEFTTQAHLHQIFSIFRIFNLDARR